MGKSHYMSYLIVVSKFIEIALLHECSWRFAAWFGKHLLCAGREVANQGCEFQVLKKQLLDTFLLPDS